MNEKTSEFKKFYYLIFIIIAIVGFLTFQKSFFSKTVAIKIVPYISILILVFLFIFQEITGNLSKKTIRILQALSVASILFIYLLAFFPVLSDCGDECEYIAKSQSLVQGKGIRLLYDPSEPTEGNLYNIGLSLLFAPVIKIFGINFFLFKLVILIFTTFIPIILYRVLRNTMSVNLSSIIAIITAINLQVVHFSSIELTENLSLFSALLAILLIERYHERDTIPNALFAGIGTFWVYMVRTQTLGFMVFAPLYFLVKKQFKKAAILFAIIITCFAVFYGPVKSFLIKKSEPVASTQNLQTVPQKSESLVKYLQNSISKAIGNTFRNTKYILLITSEKILGAPDKPTSAYNKGTFLNWIVILLILTGFLSQLAKNPTASIFYVLAIFASVFQAFPVQLNDNTTVAISRYTVTLIPFAYYYFASGLLLVFANKYIKFKSNTVKILSLAVIFYFPFINFSNDTNRIYTAKYPYNPGYQLYVNTAEWAKVNLPPGSIVASRKNRNFYFHSGLKGIYYVSQKTSTPAREKGWSKELEDDTLKLYQEKNVDYIVLDSFSNDAYDKILVIIQRYPEIFQLIYTAPIPLVNLPENFVKTLPELINFISYVITNRDRLPLYTRYQIVVPTAVFKIDKDKLAKVIKKLSL